MQKTFDVTGPVELEIKLNSGEIEVDAIDGAERVEVELTAHDEASQELIDNGRVELQQHQQRPHVIIDLQQRRGGGGFNLGSLFSRSGITCRVRVPGSSSLTVRTKSADVAARGTLERRERLDRVGRHRARPRRGQRQHQERQRRRAHARGDRRRQRAVRVR